jgi:hypothetical protein
MKRAMIGALGVAAGLAVVLSVRPVGACGYGTPSPLARFALADCVVLGKVTSIEDRGVLATQTRGGSKVEYTIAVVQVTNALKGAEGMTHVRVGVVPPQFLVPEQEAIFFLTQHSEEPFYHLGQRYDSPIQKENNAGFAAQLQTYERLARLMKDPDASLVCKDAQDRFLTAALLLTEYRATDRLAGVKGAKQEAVDATRSRLILEALAGLDWNQYNADFRIAPRGLFNQLGMTDKDGWVTRGFKDNEEFDAAAKKWLLEHASTFRIKTYVQ